MPHSEFPVSTLKSLVRPLRALAMSVALGLVSFAAGLLLLVGLTATVARPGVFSVGLWQVARAVLAFVGTALPGAIPLGVLALGFLVARRLGERGEASAWASLGLGPMDAWFSLSPIWAGGAVLALVLGMLVEPWAWTSLHGLRGTPEAAAVGWARLERGELRVLTDGGAAALVDGRLQFRSGQGSTQGWLEAPQPEPSSTSWRFGKSEVTDATGATWRAEELSLGLRPELKARYRAPPRSPRTLAPSHLWTRSTDPEEPPDRRRMASFVLYRRVALAAGVPVLGLLGWLLGWSLAPRDRGRTHRGLVLVVVAVGLYSLTRVCDHALSSGSPGPVFWAWLPWVASLVALVGAHLLRRGELR